MKFVSLAVGDSRAAEFDDDFEVAALDPELTKFENLSMAVAPSSMEVHIGQRSLQVAEKSLPAFEFGGGFEGRQLSQQQM